MHLKDRSTMIFAAGLGTRMRPLTDQCPKPLVKVGARSFLERTLDHVDAAGIQKVIVNTFYYPDLISQALAPYPNVHISYETERLETGGGAKHALPLLGQDAFFTLNGDAIWNTPNLLEQLHDQWDERRMEALLLLVPLDQAHGDVGGGDFICNERGQLQRYKGESQKSYIYAGCQIIHPRLFEKTPDVFSMNLLFDKAITTHRLYGCVLDGEWYHLSSVEDLKKWEPEITHLEQRNKVSGGYL